MKLHETVITSRQNPLVKWAASLQDGKGRDASRAFLCEGEKLSEEAVRARLPVTHVLIAQGQSERLLPRVRAWYDDRSEEDVELLVLADAAFEKISCEKTPRGIITVIKYLDFFKDMDIINKEAFFSLEGERMLALCSVRDPGNLGSVIRSAVAFGVKHLLLSADCADVYSPKVVRSAMGTLFKVSLWRVGDIEGTVRAARAAGRRVLAAELREGALSLPEACLGAEDIVIIGNEGHGIPEQVSHACDASVYIPIAPEAESLNAAVAAAVLMYAQREASI